jgi:long-subunit acyl-CoA synthetase (AMP-forming)
MMRAMAVEIRAALADWAESFVAPSADPARTLIVDAGGKEVSRAALAARVDTLTATLTTTIRDGDRVLLVAPPSAAWVAGFIAILRAGGIVVPADLGATPAEHAAQSTLAGPRCTLRGDEPAPARAPATISGRRLDDIALILPTSGTSGGSKGVALTGANLDYMVRTLCALHQPTADDVWLSLLPLSHMLELGCALLPALAAGGTVCFAPSLEPAAVLQCLMERRVTRMMTVPALLHAFRRGLELTGIELPPSLTTLYCGGAPLDDSTIDFFAARGITVYAGYGLTEASPTVSVNHPGASRSGTVGPALPGTEIAIDPITSEVLVRGPGVMAGYWQDGAVDAGAVTGGWLHTGDTGRVDTDGFLRITGRLSSLIVLTSGLKVQPEAVESELQDIPGVIDLCIAGTDEVVAVVHAQPGVDAATVHTRIVERCATLSRHRWPSRVVLSDTPLRRTRKRTIDRAAATALTRLPA